MRASLSRVEANLSGEQKQRYACPDYGRCLVKFHRKLGVGATHVKQFPGVQPVQIQAF